jgi:hypothetical protein
MLMLLLNLKLNLKYESCLVRLLHDVKVVMLWLWLWPSPFTLCKSDDMIFGFPLCSTFFLLAQHETCLVTLLHDVKVVTSWLWPSPFTLCKSGGMIFGFPLC